MLSGIVKLDGISKFLIESKKNFNSELSGAIIDIRTVHESINIYDDNLKALYNTELFSGSNQTNATHFVVGVHWGGSALYTLEQKNQENLRNFEAGLGLGGNIYSTVVIGASANTQFSNSNQKSDITIKIYGDLHMSTNPKNKEEAENELNNFKESIAKTNNKKGVQIKYELYPIEKVLTFLKIPFTLEKYIAKLDDEIFNILQSKFDEFIIEKLKFSDLNETVTKYCSMLDENTNREFLTMKNRINLFESDIKTNLKEKLIQIRSQNVGIVTISDLIKGIDDNLNTIKSFIKDKAKIGNKCSLIQLFTQYEITFLKNNQSLNMLLNDKTNQDKLIFVFFFSQDLIETNRNSFVKNLNLIKERQEQGDAKERNSAFYAYDFSTHGTKDEPVKIKIQTYRNSNLISHDLFEESKDLQSSCLAKSQQKNKTAKHPSQLFVLNLACPGHMDQKAGCAKEKQQWKCPECKRVYEYDNELNIYCECGFECLTKFEFKCNKPTHPIGYLKFKDEQVEYICDELKEKLTITVSEDIQFGWLISYIFFKLF